MAESQSVEEFDIAQAAISSWSWFEGLVSTFWSGLEWPHAALIVFCLGVVVFKNEIKALIDRVTSVSAGGVSMSSAPLLNQQNTEVEVSKDVEVANIQSLGAEFPTLMKVMKDSVDTEVKDLGAQEQLSALKSYLAYWKAMYVFENVFSNIFGGQLKILRYVNSFGSLGVTFVDLGSVWNPHVQLHKPLLDAYSLETYMNYLFAVGLVEQKDGRVGITELGKEFLMWMAKFGKVDNRPM